MANHGHVEIVDLPIQKRLCSHLIWWFYPQKMVSFHCIFVCWSTHLPQWPPSRFRPTQTPRLTQLGFWAESPRCEVENLKTQQGISNVVIIQFVIILDSCEAWWWTPVSCTSYQAWRTILCEFHHPQWTFHGLQCREVEYEECFTNYVDACPDCCHAT